MAKSKKNKTPSWHINYSDHAEYIVKEKQRDPIKLKTPTEGSGSGYGIGFKTPVYGFHLV
jgi:hypothetical protein